MKDAKVKLLLLYIIITSTIAIRIKAEATGYISPDSKFYLKTASNIVEGKGPITPNTYPFDSTTPESYTAIWPVGYPTLIASVALLSGLEVSLSSKVVNVIFLGFIFILLYRWFGESSPYSALYFCSFSLLEIYSYSWSEGAFIFFLLWAIYTTEMIIRGKNSKTRLITLSLCMVLMVFLRYAGLIYLFYLCFLAVFLFSKKRFALMKKLIRCISISSFFIMAYLLINYLYSGGFFGSAPRIFPEKEGFIEFTILLGKGLLNEFLIIRNFYWTWDIIFILTLVVQIAVCLYLLKNRKLIWLRSKGDFNGNIAIGSGLFYLIFIVVLRKLSPFESFDYRILAPFSVPIFISLLSRLDFRDQASRFLSHKTILVAFFIFSLIMNLPKQYILKWFGLS